MDEGVVLVALVPVIVVMALIGGMTQGRSHRRLALAAGAVVCLLWVAFLVAVRLSSS